MINTHGPIEDFPDDVLREKRELALLFKNLATLRTDAPLFTDVDDLLWRGPTKDFDLIAERIGDKRLRDRVGKLETKVNGET